MQATAHVSRDDPLQSPQVFIPGLPVLFVTNTLSILCSGVVLALYLFIKSINSYLVKPIPLRLAYFASFVEIAFSILRIVLLAIRHVSPTFSTAGCGAILWFYISCSLLSLFVRILLPIHLLKILFFKQYHVPFFERQYLLLAFVASTILSCLPIFSSMYGWTEMGLNCGLQPDDTLSVSSDRTNLLLWKWASYYAWMVILIMFCCFVFLTLLVQLVRDRIKLRKAFQSGPAHVVATDEANRFWFLIRKIIQRILWYPLIVILCHVGELVNAFRHTLGLEFSPWGFFLSQLLLSLQAVFTLVIVFFEPSLREAYHEYREPKPDRMDLGVHYRHRIGSNGQPSQSGSSNTHVGHIHGASSSVQTLRHSGTLSPPSPQVIPWDIVIQAIEPKASEISPAFEHRHHIV
ncbi:hypothetical protein IWQ61_009094 [Dispira simplex]|nr:hypothetical protein IWQ61_009094 [Dispira simplex]